MDDGPPAEAAAAPATAVVPTARIGAAVRRARRAACLTVAQLARAADLPSGAVRAVEDGRLRPPDTTLDALATACDTTVADLLPGRRPGEMQVHVPELSVGWRHLRLPPDAGAEDVLRSYLELLTTVRGEDVGNPPRLRADDVRTLAAALDLSEAEVERRLAGLAADARRRAVTARRRLAHGSASARPPRDAPRAPA